MATYGASETARSRHETWKAGFGRIARTNMLLSAATAISVAISGWSLTRDREVLYFVMDQDGQMTRIEPVSEPKFQDNQVINFATEAITRSMRITFDEWRDDNAKAAGYYTTEGWPQFVSALESSKTLDYIRDNKLNASATPIQAVIIDRGTDQNGVYSWVVQVQYRVNYQGAGNVDIPREYRADMVVVRVPPQDNPRAIAVSRINVT